MTIFYLVAVMLVIAALLFIVPPLVQRDRGAGSVRRSDLNVSVYRDQLDELEKDLANDVISQAQYEQSRQEIEQRLLEDVNGTDAGDSQGQGGNGRSNRNVAIVVGIALPLFAFGMYGWRGTPDAIDNTAPIQLTEGMTQEQVADQINRMVTRLASRLEEAPNDAEGWAMLARSYFALQRFDDAVTAFENATALRQDDAQLYADFADAIAMAGDESLEGRPMALIRKALEIDPDNQKALWLSGTAAYERADFAEALKYWQKLYQLMPPGSEGATVMENNIAEARALMENRESNGAGAASDMVSRSTTGSSADDSNASGKKISGVVRITPSLAGQVSASDTVFVFAQAPDGPRMPLAVLRNSARDLPLSFELDDSMAMMPQMSLSRFDEVVITARVSKSGNAQAQSGDLEGRTAKVRTGSSGVEVVIDRVTP